MPIYEYSCGACEHRFETIQKISEAPLRDCPECGAETLKKLPSAPVFRLKGSGWYETDFKTDNKRNVADAGERPADGDKADSSGKADKGKAGGAEAGGKKGDGGTGGKSEKAGKKAGDAKAGGKKGDGGTGGKSADASPAAA